MQNKSLREKTQFVIIACVLISLISYEIIRGVVLVSILELPVAVDYDVCVHGKNWEKAGLLSKLTITAPMIIMIVTTFLCDLLLVKSLKTTIQVAGTRYVANFQYRALYHVHTYNCMHDTFLQL